MQSKGASPSALKLLQMAQEARDNMQTLPGEVISASYGGVMLKLDNGLRGVALDHLNIQTPLHKLSVMQMKDTHADEGHSAVSSSAV